MRVNPDVSKHTALLSPFPRSDKMTKLLLKAALSGVLIAIISEVARRFPGFGGLIASLPLISLLATRKELRDRTWRVPPIERVSRRSSGRLRLSHFGEILPGTGQMAE